MGLNFNYLLYLPKNQLWHVLLGLGNFCDIEGVKPTTIQFPDHDLNIPLTAAGSEKPVIPHNKPKMDFAISMNFEEDEAILDYLRHRDGNQFDRSPPEDGIPRIHSIGFIYLTVYTDLSHHFAFEKPANLVLLRFGTTGTKMSLLFDESESIRRTFCEILRTNQGTTGIFDREMDGSELFWFRGKEYQYSLGEIYMLPEEIDETLKNNDRS
jgi:hypothetical protein